MTNDLLQLGAVAVIFLFSIKEFFAWLKSRKGNGSTEIVNELKHLNDNHLQALKDAINTGNDRIVDAINSSSVKQIELLGEIKGKLSK